MSLEPAYAVAFIDWLACACAGARERAATAMRSVGEGVVADTAFAATAGHVLDFDDTFADGLAHVSAACAPAALVVSARLGLSLCAALDAYADAYEAMAAVAEASHPALYDTGWHPTAVCGPIGAVVAASRLLELTALLRAGGTRGAFGSDGKAIQVGLAAAAGVQAALLAHAGATVDLRAIHGPVGFEMVVGATVPPRAVAGTRDGSGAVPAIERNWIKFHPSCLGTHSPIDAARQVTEEGGRLDGGALEVVVHPLARQAAHLDAVSDGLSAKFSIPYCVAHTFMFGAPRVRDFAAVDPDVLARAELVSVEVDESLPKFGAVLTESGGELARVEAPKGSPERPIDASELAEKVSDLAGGRLDGLLDDLERPASDVRTAAGL